MSESLGLKGVSEEQYEVITKFRNHTYTVAPPSGFMSPSSVQAVTKLLGGSLDPVMTIDQIERLRERIQVADKREQQRMYQQMSVVWFQRLSGEFRNHKKIIHKDVETMFPPSSAPKYFDAVRALYLPRKRWWKQEPFAALEQIARLPLHTSDLHTGAIHMTFEEWYHIHWNFYMPFNPVQFVCNVTSEPCVWTDEFVKELAGYCKERLETKYEKDLLSSSSTSADGKSTVKKSGGGGKPIVMIGAMTGKLAFLLNQTKILPVPVIATHEKPSQNPYILSIPQSKQKEYALKPVQSMKPEEALEKYQPSIVLMPNMKANIDTSSVVRRFGCVKEYLTIGIPDSYSEGHGWDTFGNAIFRAKDDKTGNPAYMIDGFRRTNLKFISRWLLHKHDSRECFGVGTVESFVKQSYAHSRLEKIGYSYLRRFKPRFY